MQAVRDAVVLLQRHPALSSVGQPMLDNGGFEIEATIEVSLPSRFRVDGVTPNGIRAIEPCWLTFPVDWPMRAPEVWLREDFPLNLPHINPHKVGQRVNPCLFEGSLDEVLHRFGLERIVDQLSEWLSKAASGQLIDMQQGWEPTRRDSSPSTVVFSAEDAIARVPLDGALLLTRGSYFAYDGTLLAYAAEDMQAVEPAFSQQHYLRRSFKWAGGDLPFLFARCVDDSGAPRVVSEYLPETVEDLPSLLERAASLGARSEQIQSALNRYVFQMTLQRPADADWSSGVFAVVVLLVHRPASLVGSPGRQVEVLPYVVRFILNEQKPLEPVSHAHPAFHSHRVSPALLSLASGLPAEQKRLKLLMLGCGSLGSKVALHLGRAGVGNMTFIDNEVMSPHNGARHALIPRRQMAFNPYKATLMEQALGELGHDDCESYQIDAADLLLNEEMADQLLGQDEAVIIDTTASLLVASAATVSVPLTKVPSRRLVQTGMYAQGKAVYLFAEGAQRSVTAEDLRARLFENCRHDAALRARISGETSDPTRIFVGDNCRSLTMPMTDSKVSRAAAMVGSQLERWLTQEMPVLGQLCFGLEDASGVGMNWTSEELQPSVVLSPAHEDGWTVRVLASVAQAIDVDAKQWGRLETGGALIGHVSHTTRTIIVAGLIDAPSDSKRSESRFILGTTGLVSALRSAHDNSLGHLHFVGTWHSHPMGGKHSSLDRDTLSRIAKDFEGCPAVSLVWTPQGLVVVVEQL